MVEEVFNVLYRKLETFYEKSKNNQDFKNMALRLFQNVPTNEANKIYEHIILTYERFPSLIDLRNIALKFEVTPKAKEYNEKCVYCLGSGLIPYRRETAGLTYKYTEHEAACVCKKGRSYKNERIKGIEEVYPTSYKSILAEYEKRNTGRRNVPELQKQFFDSLDKMGRL